MMNRAFSPFPIALLTLISWQVGCGKTDVAPTTSPTATVEQFSSGMTQLAPPTRMAEAPECIENLVLVGNDQFPDRFSYGRYVQQSQGRPIVIVPLDYYFNLDPRLTDFWVEHNGQEYPARFLARPEGHNLFVLEVIAELSPPVTPSTIADPSGDLLAYYFDHATTRGATRTLVRQKVRFDAANQTVHPDVPYGASLYDQQGNLYAIRYEPNQRRAKAGHTGIFRISNLERLLQPSAAVQASPLQWKPQHPASLIFVALQDPLQDIAKVSVLVDTAQHVSAKKMAASETLAEGPVAEGMQRIELQALDPMNYRGICGFIDSPQLQTAHLVYQAELQWHDGSVTYGPPSHGQYSKEAYRRDLQPLTDEEWTELVAQLPDSDVSLDYPEPLAQESMQVFEPHESNDVVQYEYPLKPLGQPHSGPRDQILPDAAWSADGAFVYLLSRLGRLHKIRLKDHTETQWLDMMDYCADLDISQHGLVVLGQRGLRVIDIKTLEILREIPIASASHCACGERSSIAYVAVRNQVLRVDLLTGTVTSLTLTNPPFQRFLTGLEVSEDGRTIVASDESRIYRCVEDSDFQLKIEETSPLICQAVALIFQQGGDRVALMPERLYAGRQPPEDKLMLSKQGGVFDISDLSQPSARVAYSRESGGLIFSPFSGGIVSKDFRETQFMREDGQLQGSLTIGGSTAFRGFADPHSGRFILIGELQPEVHEIVCSGLLGQRDALRESSKPERAVGR